MNYQEAKDFINHHKETIVEVRRSWNNSMYIYSDYVSVWDGENANSHFLGIDFFDAFSFKVDESTQAYKEYRQKCDEMARKQRKEKIKNLANMFRHHGYLASFRLAYWIRSLNSDYRDIYTKLLKVKNFRSNFRRSLCRQVINWIDTPRSQRKYNSPLSPRQERCL